MRRVWRAVGVVAAASFAGLTYLYLIVPDVRDLRTHNPATTAFMDLRAREARARGDEPRHVHRWVPYRGISESLKRAVLVAEDSAFWQHAGVDVEQIRVSIETSLERRRVTRGASTITQQLAKNLYLSPSRNPVRKYRELLIARRLEAELSKRRILEIYLNVIEWGDGIYGVEAASRAYFQKPAASLGPEESALLAGAIINPRLYQPSRPNARLRGRQRLILRRMGFVEPPPAEAPLASAAPVEVGTPDEGSDLLPTSTPTVPVELLSAPHAAPAAVEEPQQQEPQ